MSAIILWDKTEITVTREQAEQIKEVIDSVEHIEIANEWIRTSAIARIKLDTPPLPVPDRPRISPRANLSDDELSKRRAKLAEMKTQFLKRRRNIK